MSMIAHPSLARAALWLSVAIGVTVVPLQAQTLIAEFEQNVIRPTSGLIKGPNLDNSNDRLYGLSEYGGSGGSGVLFSWEPATSTFVEQVDFGRDFYASNAPSDVSGRVGRGQQRIAVVGNIVYGVTREGGATGHGVIWRWDPAQLTAKLTKIGDFEITSTGAYPEHGVITDGTNLYGTCSVIGTGGNARGCLWKLPLTGGVIENLATFNAGDSIGTPTGGVAFAENQLFGLSEKADGTQLLWRLDPAAGTPALSIAKTFSASTEGKASGTLAAGSGDNLFGPIYDIAGGTGDGVFLYNLVAPNDVRVPNAGLTQAVGDIQVSTSGADVYIATRTSTGRGSVFTWNRQASEALVNVGSFGTAATDPLSPTGTVFKAAGGTIYGTSQLGGANGEGTLWKLSGSTPTTAGTMSIDRSFSPPALGANPQGLAAESNGNIYGTEAFGSSVWRWNPITGGSTIVKLASASYVGDGFPPVGQIAVDANGAVYGVTDEGGPSGTGSLWKWTQHSGLTRQDIRVGTTLIPGRPSGGLVCDSLGNLYGVNNQIAGLATDPPVTTLWRRSPNGNFSILKTFAAGVDGAFGIGTLAIGPAMTEETRQMVPRAGVSAIYGICTMGGTLSGGSLWAYELDAEGFEVRGYFRPAVTNGGHVGKPRGGIIVLPSGLVFGTSGGFSTEAAKLWKWTPAELPEEEEDPPPPMPPYNPTVHANFSSATFGNFTEHPTGRSNPPNTPINLSQCALTLYNGAIYGVTDFGTSLGCGSLWSANTTTPVDLTVVKQFKRNDGFDGGRGLANMVRGADGRMFGVTPNALWAVGTASGSVPPTVVTDSVATFTASSFTFRGRVNPNGLSTAVTIEWGLSEGTLTNVLSVPGPLTGSTVQNVSAAATFLNSSTDYFYRVVAVNSAGTSRGSVSKQTTNPRGQAPVVTTLPATNITHDSATLNGTVTPTFMSTNVFDWGLSPAPPSNRVSATPPTSVGITASPITAAITGLLPHTTYHYRTVAASSQGVTLSNTLVKFTTLNRPPVGNADTFLALIGAPATLDVLGNDTDLDSDVLSIQSFTQPPSAQGKVSKVGSNLLFTPAKTFTGGATFTYIARDNFGGSTSPTTVTVNAGTISLNPMSNPGTLLAAAHTYPITVDVGGVPTAWSAVETATYVTLNVTRGIGNGTVQVSVAANTSRNPRSTSINFCGQIHTITQPGVVVPVLNAIPTPPPAIVSGNYNLPITTSTPALPMPVYSTSKLPAGLKLVVNPATGGAFIQGKPTLAGSFPVSVKASNAAVSASLATPINFTIVVQPLPAHFIGSHVGLNNGNGAYIAFTTMPNGTLTGTLKLGASTAKPETYSFKSVLDTLPAPPPAMPTDPPNPVPPATTLIVVPLSKNLSIVVNLTLNTAATAGDNILTGIIDLSVPETPTNEPPAILAAGWRNKWNATSDPATTKREAVTNKPLDDYFTSALNPPAGSELLVPAVPQGQGFCTLTIKPDGTAQTQLYLPDMERVSATETIAARTLKTTTIISPRMGDFQRLIIWHPLYKRSSTFFYGAVGGIVRVDRSVVAPALEPFDGLLQWFKDPEPPTATPKAKPEFTYTQGYSTTLTLAGQRYEPPANGVALGLPGGTTNNTRITFSLGGLTSTEANDLTQSFILSPTNTTTFAAPNVNGLALTFDNNLGLFSGRFRLTNLQGATVITRNVFFQGVLIQDPAFPVNGRGRGCFLLRGVPVVTGGTTANTPRLSGNILIQSL
jgi:hypothetical protein